VVHTLLHEAAVIMVHVGHVVSGRGRLLLLLLLRGASGDERGCQADAEERYYRHAWQMLWRYESIHMHLADAAMATT
jgi:hypothetical protein